MIAVLHIAYDRGRRGLTDWPARKPNCSASRMWSTVGYASTRWVEALGFLPSRDRSMDAGAAFGHVLIR